MPFDTRDRFERSRAWKNRQSVRVGKERRKRRLGQEGSEKKKGRGCSFFSVHDGKCRAEQSSWRRLNKSHYKLASAGCTKLTNSLYIKTNRPSRFLPIRPGWSRNGYKLQKWLLVFPPKTSRKTLRLAHEKVNGRWCRGPGKRTSRRGERGIII